MGELLSAVRVIHILTAILMAWPFYALVAVQQRVRLGPPLGDRVDTYMENIIKNRTIPCFVFQVTAGISGLVLIYLRGQNLGVLVTNPVIGLKFGLLLLIMILLAIVHTRIQPRIDTLFAEAPSPMPSDVGARIGALRARRKRLASVCMFVVFTIAMLGMQSWVSFPLWLTLLLVLGIGAFTWRAYTSETPYGWV